jgi:hypothetical protein
MPRQISWVRHRSRPDEAQKLYGTLPSMYHDAKWTTLEADVLKRCRDLQLELGLSRERLVASVALLRTGEAERLTQEEGEKLFDDLRTLTRKLEKGRPQLSPFYMSRHS